MTMKTMTTTTDTDEPTRLESETTETVDCGFCGREVFRGSATTVGAGLGSDYRAYQMWCRTCANGQFDLPESAFEKHLETTREYITPATVAAFCLGLLLMLLMASVMVV